MRAQRRNAITPYSQEASAIRSFAHYHSLNQRINRSQLSNATTIARNSQEQSSVEEISNLGNNRPHLDSDTEEDPSNSFAAPSA